MQSMDMTGQASDGIDRAIEPSGRAASGGRHLRFVCVRCKTPIDLDRDGGRCRSCGFVPKVLSQTLSFVDSEPDQWYASWESFAQQSDGETSKGADYRFQGLQKLIIDGLRETCRIPSASALCLDVGCGSGAFWKAAFDRNDVVGVDYSPGMCELAHRKGMRAFNANALALPFEGSQFDLVYSAELLQYVADPRPLLAELCRVTRTGGQIVVSTLNRTSLQRRVVRTLLRAWRGRRSNDPVALHTATGIQASARGLPLAVRSVRWIFFPVGSSRTTSRAASVLSPLATNFIVVFEKTGT